MAKLVFISKANCFDLTVSGAHRGDMGTSPVCLSRVLAFTHVGNEAVGAILVVPSLVVMGVDRSDSTLAHVHSTAHTANLWIEKLL